MRASIVIPVKNGARDLPALLAALRVQEAAPTPEVVAIDSGSTDGSVALLQEAGARVLTIPPQEFNHGATRNRGIAEAGGEFVVLLTQDAVPADGRWLHHLLAPFADPAVAGVYARQIPRPEADAVTRRQINAWIIGGTERVVQRKGEDWDRLTPFERMRRCNFDNVCSAVRRSAWEAIPFPRASIAEDLEWGKRVLEAGLTLVYEPAAAVIHSHDRPARYQFRRDYLCHRRLYRLFGLRTVPTWGQCLRALVRAGAGDARCAWREEPTLGKRLRGLGRGPLHAAAKVLGQFLGGRDEAAGRPWPEGWGV